MAGRIAIACGLVLAACSVEHAGSDAGPPELAALPEALSARDLEKSEKRLAYRPAHELWSNGSRKRRLLELPAGAVVDTGSRERWAFPLGTLFLKTFSYPREDGSERPVETRALRRASDGFEYAAYVWNDAGTEATRADIAQAITVEVETSDGPLDHRVPSRLECRKCHESQPVAVLGFDELALSEALEAEGPSQLEVLYEAGVLSELPQAPAHVDHPDPETRAILGYLEGNCAHCHNGSGLASSSFDLRHEAALANLIDQETEGESVGGIRLVPGDPDASALYRALEGGRLFPDVAAMPPLGVDRRDERMIERVRAWIEGMEEAR